MPKSVFSGRYDNFRALLMSTRRASGITQIQLARSLGKPQSFVSKYESGERRIDVVEFLEIALALHADPAALIRDLASSSTGHSARRSSGDILQSWDFTPAEFTHLIDDNPSLRGILLGYLAELKLEKLLVASPDVSACRKYDDHDRKKKGDRVITYRGRDYTVEVKSLQSNSVTRLGTTHRGKVQVDASDRRTVRLPDGTRIETTCLIAGEFDMLAVNLFAFENEWRFAFAKNSDLPRSTFSKYTPRQRRYLLATLVEVSWPPAPPFYEDPFRVLDEIGRGRKL